MKTSKDLCGFLIKNFVIYYLEHMSSKLWAGSCWSTIAVPRRRREKDRDSFAILLPADRFARDYNVSLLAG